MDNTTPDGLGLRGNNIYEHRSSFCGKEGDEQKEKINRQ